MGDGYAALMPARWRIGLAGLAVVATVPVLVQEPAGPGPVAGRVLAGLLVLVQAAAFWWLAARPWPGTAVALLASAGLQVLYPGLGPGLAFVALCTYAWLRPAAQTVWGLALATVAACGPAAARGHWELAALWLGGVVLAWSWGALARARGARRVAERRQAVLEERARIARELHDVLSHTVSVMVVQAAAADDVFELDPVRARQAVRRTEQAGREALAELRWFLRTVRADDDEAAGPQPTLADVDRLAGTMGEAGLPVTVLREGSTDGHPAVQLGAYRIVQEALTNTLRHAHAAGAEVLLRITDQEVYVRIRDDGRGGPIRRSGHGIAGMRERAELLGGDVQAGPRPDGGFEVSARLPLGDPGGPA